MSDHNERENRSTEEPVIVEERGPVLIVTINRPRARNALNARVATLIAQAMDTLDASPNLRAGVLTGAEGNFSAGMDLKAFAQGESPFLQGRGLCGITVTPPRKPLIAAVEGWALAGGLELLLACDLVIAAESARLGVPEVKRGLVAAGGGAYLLAKRLPLSVAMELLLVGEPFSATRAMQVGLVNHVTSDGHALSDAVALAETIAANGPVAVEVSKQIALAADSWTGTSGWDAQDAVALRVLASEDAKEGARAFAEKRTPVWQGR